MLFKKRIQKIRLLGALFIPLFSQNIFAAHALPEFHAIYSIEFYSIEAAEAHYNLSYTDTGYKFTHKTRLTGLASMFASDTVDAVSYVDDIDNNLLLKKHSFVQTGREKNRDEDISIEWESSSNQLKGKISGISRSNNINLETSTPVWEALSFQLPLMIEASKDKKEYPFNAILKGEINTYNFVLTSVNNVEFSGKVYQALQMVRTDPKRDRQLHIWLIPELNNIPVYIDAYRDGKKRSRGTLKSIQFNNEKALTDTSTDIDDEL